MTTLIRLWWKGACQRCFIGHNGAVSTLSDKLLGDEGAKVLASSGEDGTVRLWSLSSSGKHGQKALKAMLYGHEKPVMLMLVAGHAFFSVRKLSCLFLVCLITTLRKFEFYIYIFFIYNPWLICSSFFQAQNFLLVTMSKDSKVRVWDTSTSSAIRSSCCVGMASVAGAPVDINAMKPCSMLLLFFSNNC
ncbi:uncharacterized protein LOC111292396 isoform X1 [Durio zibethinus]|uniref:Uncharacterized protein LOC111292396 isoform X1 n=1 Tax=Durio zibethinus TaxID=66656 RepID=A0A6P5YJL8_DURZI|nr:uncharacterized protein LOC111292396 isoform X1 [Durio zibethinus]XP_022740508.1 uncharacterized protein LOC111292396 isoform X1 [Durio zibethinus]